MSEEFGQGVPAPRPRTKSPHAVNAIHQEAITNER